MIILQAISIMLVCGGSLLSLHYFNEAKRQWPEYAKAKGEYKKYFGTLEAYKLRRYEVRISLLKSAVATLFVWYFLFLTIVLSNPLAWL